MNNVLTACSVVVEGGPGERAGSLVTAYLTLICFLVGTSFCAYFTLHKDNCAFSSSIIKKIVVHLLCVTQNCHITIPMNVP